MGALSLGLAVVTALRPSAPPLVYVLMPSTVSVPAPRTSAAPTISATAVGEALTDGQARPFVLGISRLG